jgi:hypothetical protein
LKKPEKRLKKPLTLADKFEILTLSIKTLTF